MGGAGGKPREERRLLLHEGTGQGFGGHGPQFLPMERRPLPLLAAGKLASTAVGRRLTCVRQEL